LSKTVRKQAKKAPTRKSPAVKAAAGASARTVQKPAAKKSAKRAAPVATPQKSKTATATVQKARHKAAAPVAAHKHDARRVGKPAAKTPIRHPAPAKHAAPAKDAAAAKRPAAPAKHAAAPKPAAPPKGAEKAMARVAATQPAPVGKAAPATKPVKAAKGAKGAADRIEITFPVSTPEDRQSQLKLLIGRGKEQGFLTYAEVNDHLPSEIVDPEQIEDIVQMINDMGIPVYEKAPDAEALLLREPVVADDEAAEEAAAALATTVDAEFGRTTDPVRMYMREMGTVELLTREGEIAIAKRIEEGLDSVRRALAVYPPTCELILRTYEPLKGGQGRLADIIVGFVDPNAPDVIAEPVNPKLAAAAKELAEEETEGEEGAEDEEVVDTGPDPEEAARRFASLAKLYGQVVKALDDKGGRDPRTA